MLFILYVQTLLRDRVVGFNVSFRVLTSGVPENYFLNYYCLIT